MAFNRTEQEAITLNAVWSMVDEMVNFAIFMPLGDRRKDTNLMPRTTDTRRLFHILLGDFLSPLIRKGKRGLPFDLPAPARDARPSDLTFLFYLRTVCDDPQLSSIPAQLRDPVEAFSTWLEADTHIEKVWLPSIGVELDLTINRITWLKICSDIGKHSFARLEPNVAKIVRILSEHGKEIDEGMGYAVLPEFWEWFHEHLFAYHLSTIAEFLNNIRWGIFEYLQPEFTRAYHVTSHDPRVPSYAFHVPAEVTAPIARTMYWDLMNLARSAPYFPKFTTTHSLKNQF
jgi:hypothetical protein